MWQTASKRVESVICALYFTTQRQNNKLAIKWNLFMSQSLEFSESNSFHSNMESVSLNGNKFGISPDTTSMILCFSPTKLVFLWLYVPC